LASPAEAFSLSGLNLTFEEVDRETFGALDLAFDAGRRGGSSPAVLNAADEIAVEAFLQHRLGFLGITDVVGRTLAQVEWRELDNVDDVIDVDREAREMAASLIGGAC
jgi:1-deoxy-D-xylulose-5-phosphate reductoisomerase